MSLPSYVLTPENLATLDADGRADNQYPTLHIQGETLSKELLRRYRFLRMCQAAPEGQEAKSCNANQAYLDKTASDLQFIDALVAYHGEITLSETTIPYELFRKFYGRTAKTNFMNIIITLKIPVTLVETEKERIKAEIAGHQETIKLGSEINFSNEGYTELARSKSP